MLHDASASPCSRKAAHKIVLAQGVLIHDGLEHRDLRIRLVDRGHRRGDFLLHLAHVIGHDIDVHAHRLVKQDGASTRVEFLVEHLQVVTHDGVGEDNVSMRITRFLPPTRT